MTGKDRHDLDPRRFELELAEELGFGHKVLESEDDWREKLTDREITLLTRGLIRKLTHQEPEV